MVFASGYCAARLFLCRILILGKKLATIFPISLLVLLRRDPARRIDAAIARKVLAWVCPAEDGKCPITDLHCKVDSSERVLLDAHGRRVPILKSVVGMKLDGRECLIECFLDLTERKRTEEELKKAQGELLYASRLAGMAEVATSVLHNVGNVLNSVNVSINRASHRIGGRCLQDQRGRGHPP